MTWKYIPTDKHTLSHLLEVKRFYQQNALTKLAEYKKAKSYQKYGLPGWRTEMLRRRMGYEVALKSLDNVLEAINNHE